MQPPPSPSRDSTPAARTQEIPFENRRGTSTWCSRKIQCMFGIIFMSTFIIRSEHSSNRRKSACLELAPPTSRHVSPVPRLKAKQYNSILFRNDKHGHEKKTKGKAINNLHTFRGHVRVLVHRFDRLSRGAASSQHQATLIVMTQRPPNAKIDGRVSQSSIKDAK